MSRPSLEVADVLGAAAASGRKFSWLTWLHLKVLAAILRCRTPLLGGHQDACTQCGHQAISYNSCRNRHCPKCQVATRDRWIEARSHDLLPTPYVHVVFTLPHQLAPLALQNKQAVYDLLFRASSEALLKIARDPQHLGAEIGFFSILHTWSQQLLHHPHVHCVIPAGGLSADHSRWIGSHPSFFLPVRALMRVFRRKIVLGLRRLHAKGQLEFHGSLSGLQSRRAFGALLRSLYRKDWVVYCKRPFGGAEHVIHYLGRYTHRVAISNQRLVKLEDGRITFRWRDSAHKNKKRFMTLKAEEFFRRFLLHVLPPGFVRIRYFGLFAHRNRNRLLPVCLNLLVTTAPRPCAPTASRPPLTWSCPQCGAPMIVQQRFTAVQLRLRSPPAQELPAL